MQSWSFAVFIHFHCSTWIYERFTVCLRKKETQFIMIIRCFHTSSLQHLNLWGLYSVSQKKRKPNLSWSFGVFIHLHCSTGVYELYTVCPRKRWNPIYHDHLLFVYIFIAALEFKSSIQCVPEKRTPLYEKYILPSSLPCKFGLQYIPH